MKPMVLNKQTLLSILVADLFVLAGAFFIMQDRWRLAHKLSDVSVATSASAPIASLGEPSTDVNRVPAALEARPGITVPVEEVIPKRKTDRSYRNIRFSFRHSKPERVEIIGSFNNWKPQVLEKGPNHTWTIDLRLTPGDYTYNFVVDGRVVRDPNNRRVAAEGRSLLTVKPLEP